MTLLFATDHDRMSSPKESAEKDRAGEPPKAVVSRLSFYLRELQHTIRQGSETTNSTLLGARLGISDAQVRKDLAYFGQFGRPGIGYSCTELVREIRRILGADRTWPIALIGAGNLGRALLRYNGFSERGFHIVAAFDTDNSKVGQKLEGVAIHGLESLPVIVEDQEIRMAIIATPAESAQLVADKLVEAGIVGVFNFAPVAISLPNNVAIAEVDLAMELEQLSFAVVNL